MGKTSFAAVVAFWLAAMGWLLLTKIFPIFDPSPQPAAPLAHAVTPSSQQTCWGIDCEGVPVGFASNLAESDGEGRFEVTSLVRLTDLPVGQLLSNFMSSWGGFAGWLSPLPQNTTVSLATNTSMLFVEGRLERFESAVSLDDVGPVFEMTGTRQKGGLLVEVLPSEILARDGWTEPIFSSVISVPDDTLIVDAFSPYSELTNLRVGKRWQMRSYRAFPPTQPIRVVDANVERTEMIMWEGDITTCYVVGFVDADTSGPTAAATSLGQMWVDDDGTVLKQSLWVGGVKLEFTRKSQTFCDSMERREVVR